MAKKSSPIVFFFCIVTVFALIDMSIIVGVAWTSLTITENRFVLGIVLCGSVLIPFLISKISKTKTLKWRKVLALRLIDYFLLGCYALIEASPNPVVFFALAMIHGVSNFYTLSAFEAQNAQNVINKIIDSKKASRYLQTCLQVGYFLGAFAAGQLISKFAFGHMIQIMATLGLASAMAALFWEKSSSFNPAIGEAHSEPQRDKAFGKTVYILSLVLGFIGFHIGCFNSLIPIIFQKLNYWDASSYGYASALAGLGAFAAGMLSLPRSLPTVCAIALVGADFALVFSSNLVVALFFCVLLGFSISTLRIELRRQLTVIAKTPEQAHFVANTSSFVFMLMQGFSPLLMTALTADSLLEIASARWLFVIAGICVMTIFLATNQYRNAMENS